MAMTYVLTGYDAETGDPKYNWVDDGSQGQGDGSATLDPVTVTTPRGATDHTAPPAPDLLPMPQLPDDVGGQPAPDPSTGYHTTPTGDVYGPATPDPSTGYHTTPTGDVYGPNAPKTGIGDSLLKNFGLSTGKDGIDWSHADWSKILGAGFGAATLAHGLNQQPYSPTSAADLLKKQPSNTPTWSADQTATMRQPLQLGNHPGGSAGGSSIVAGSSMPLTLSQFGQQPNAAPQQLPTTLSPLGAGYQATRSHAFAEGGSVSGALSMMGDSGQAFSGAVQGDDPGQSDLIDAKLSAGEYVLDAETVSMLGDGNTAAGVAKLDELRQKLREQKRSAPNGEIPDTVQGPLTSLLGGQDND